MEGGGTAPDWTEEHMAVRAVIAELELVEKAAREAIPQARESKVGPGLPEVPATPGMEVRGVMAGRGASTGLEAMQEKVVPH